jgi:putative spermidine/putrescine transport system substrate-binding protein
MKNKTQMVGAAALTLTLVVTACGSSKSSTSAPKEVGKGEGALSIIAWAGYAENGSNSPDTNWVKPFEDKTGCKTTVKIGNTSDEMVSLMRSGGYDGVSASGDATLRLIANGDVAPVNPDLVANYKDIEGFLKMTKYNSKDGVSYGIPHGWGANLLMFNTDVVNPAPTSWGAVFDPNSPYKGKITAYDSPIYIADAALYLSKTQPDLKITDPYSLDDAQFKASVDLLKQQKTIVGEYWNDYLKQQSAFDSGSIVLGTTWQFIHNLVVADGKVKVNSILPSEGSTAWSDTWMVSSKAKHPNCMYMWLDYVTSPDVQAEITFYYGEAPANTKACDLNADMKAHCEQYGARDEAFHSQLHYWTVPTKDCLDGRGSKCVAYADWVKAWTEIKG